MRVSCPDGYADVKHAGDVFHELAQHHVSIDVESIMQNCFDHIKTFSLFLVLTELDPYY